MCLAGWRFTADCSRSGLKHQGQAIVEQVRAEARAGVVGEADGPLNAALKGLPVAIDHRDGDQTGFLFAAGGVDDVEHDAHPTGHGPTLPTA